MTGACAVPLPAQTLVGVPVDDTIGLLVPDLAELDAIVTTLEERLAVLDPILPDVPAIVIPAPSANTQTQAWILCLDAHGAPQECVEIQIRASRGGLSGRAYTQVAATAVSGADGLAMVEIPRDPTLHFVAKRGRGEAAAAFVGVDADTLELPSVLGRP